jgi:FtsP/CotA-like multicopper oxidase with cupredoxin domain
VSIPVARARTFGRGYRIFFLVFLVVVALAGIILFLSPYLFRGSTPGGPELLKAKCESIPTNSPVVHAAPGGDGKNAYFLIVETDPPSNYAGINGSYYVPKSTPWPILNVRIGQNVSIHVINCASSEPHGFQVQYYDDRQNISIQPGQSYDVTFLATKAGTFRIYCGIPCAIHALMQNGALIVS